jgi:hypothetical protein
MRNSPPRRFLSIRSCTTRTRLMIHSVRILLATAASVLGILAIRVCTHSNIVIEHGPSTERRKARNHPDGSRRVGRNGSRHRRHLTHTGTSSKCASVDDVELQHPCPQEFSASSTVHSAFEGLQPVDLTFGLAVAPGEFDGVPDCIDMPAQRPDEALNRFDSWSASTTPR